MTRFDSINRSVRKVNKIGSNEQDETEHGFLTMIGKSGGEMPCLIMVIFE